MAALNLDAAELMQDVTITFTLTRTFRVRMWIAGLLIRLAGFALGTTMVIVTVNDDADEAGA